MRAYAFKGFFACAFAVVFSLAITAFSFLLHLSSLSPVARLAEDLGGAAGTAEYYLYTPSSGAVRKSELTLVEALQKEGESVRFTFSEGGVDEFVKSVLRYYKAEVCFCERVGEVVSTYARSNRLGEGVTVEGKRVNLHIAVRGNAVAVGTPIIFGGY